MADLGFNAIHNAYIQQILIGCGSKSCRRPYCLSNPHGYQARNGRIKTAAATQQATNLVALRGPSLLCESFDRSQPIEQCQESEDSTSDVTPKYTLSHSMLKTKTYSSLPSFDNGSWRSMLDQSHDNGDGKEVNTFNSSHDSTLKSMANPTSFLIHLIQHPEASKDINSSLAASRKPTSSLNHSLFAFHSRIQLIYGVQFMGDAVVHEKELLWGESEQEETREVIKHVWSPDTEQAKQSLVASLLATCRLRPPQIDRFLVTPHNNDVGIATLHNAPYLKPFFGCKSSAFSSILAMCDSFIVSHKAKGISRVPRMLTIRDSHDLTRQYCFRRMSNVHNWTGNYLRVCEDLGLTQTEFLPRASCFYIVLSRTRDDDILKQLMQYIYFQFKTPFNLQLPLKVQFSDGEVGLDLGGVQLELFDIVGRVLVSLDSPYFQHDDNGVVWIRENKSVSPAEWGIIGAIVGLALHNGCPLSFDMPLSFYRALQKSRNTRDLVTLTDFKQHDPIAYNSLLSLRELDDGELESLGLVSGSGLPVANQREVDLYIREYINAPYKSEYIQTILAFIVSGFQMVCHVELAQRISEGHLKRLVEGSILSNGAPIDVEPLLKQLSYKGGYSESSIQVTWLKDYLRQLPVSKLKLFLHFITGSDRVSIGTKQGQRVVKITIQLNGVNTDCLPSASTCFCILFLPAYENNDKLVRYMDMALEHSVGFGLM